MTSGNFKTELSRLGRVCVFGVLMKEVLMNLDLDDVMDSVVEKSQLHTVLTA